MKLSLVARLALTAWIVLIVGVSVRVAVSPPTKQSVVPIYRAAGERWSQGDSLYNPAPPLDTFRYPPGFAAFWSFLAKLPETPVAVAWRLLGIALFLVGLRRMCEWGFGSFPLVALLALSLVLPSFNNGQVNVHIIGLILLGAAAAGRAEWNMSAGWLAVAVGIKLYPLGAALLVYLLFVKPLSWRLALGLIAAFGIPFLLQYPLYVWHEHVSLLDWMGRDNRLNSPALERVPRDWTVLTRTWLGWVPAARIVFLAAGLAGVAMAGLVAWGIRRRGSAAMLPVAVALGGIWMTLFGPATESVTYCLVAPGAAWLVATGRRTALGLATAGYLLHLSPVLRDMFPQGWTYNVYGPQAAGAILMILAIVIRVLTTQNSTAEAVPSERADPIRIPIPAIR